MMFNTYSGTKVTQNIDVSNFGTMQKGQLNNNIDFFAASQQQTTQQPTQGADVPNFSKKKQPLEQDLIWIAFNLYIFIKILEDLSRNIKIQDRNI